MIDSKLLDIICCPACRGDVEYDLKKEIITCTDCKTEYPVKEGIPVMLYEKKDDPEE